MAHINLPKQGGLSRNSAIDILKGIGIFFVVFGHVNRNHTIREYIWDFHMPLFFWISGLLFDSERYNNFWPFLKAKIRTIYVPYVFFFLLTFAYWFFIERRVRGNYSVGHQLLGLPYGTYEGEHLNFNGALWFLPCLFSVQLLFYFVAKLKNAIAIIFVLVLFFIAGSLIHDYKLNILPFGLHTAMFGIVFYGIGYFCKGKPLSSFLNSTLPQKLLIIFACFAIQLYCLGRYQGTMEAANFPFIFLALFGISLYLTIAGQIGQNKVIEYIGKNSLVILAMQEQSYRALIFVVSKGAGMDVNDVRRNIILCLLISMLTIALSIPVIYIFNRYIKIGIEYVFGVRFK
ncbi:acyltransferase family protein [Mucilaginibacter sp. HD30]